MQQSNPSTWRRSVAGATLLATLVIGLAGFTVTHERHAIATTVVASRDVLVEASPADANGQVLQLVRYDIPAGVVLPQHTHPGTQEAYIESGVLTYHVVEGGTIPVTRADGSADELGPGDSTQLHPGDTVVELPGVVHYGENIGPDTVVILAATLLDPDEPASVGWTPVASPAATPAN